MGALLILFLAFLAIMLFGVAGVIGMERFAFHIWMLWPAPWKRAFDLPPPVLAWAVGGGLLGMFMGYVRALAATQRWGRRPWWLYALVVLILLGIGGLDFLRMHGLLSGR